MTPTELKLAHEVAKRAEEARDALVNFQSAVKALCAKSKDRAATHQFIEQATALAGLSKVQAGIKREQDFNLENLELTPTVVAAFSVGPVLVPDYRYEPKKRPKAELLDKSPKAWNHVLGTLAEAGQGKAVEQRLSGTVLVQEVELLRKCDGLVAVRETDTWSVTKAS